MLSQEQQKAIIEAMLFVSTEPVPLPKIVRKLRYINHKQKMGETVDDVTQDTVVEGDAACEPVEAQVSADEAPILSLQTLLAEFGSSLALADNTEPDVDDEAEATLAQLQKYAAQNAEQTVSEQAEQANDQDVLAQLLEKQKEFEDEITNHDVKKLLKDIQDDFAQEAHGIELVVVAKGYQLRTKYAPSQWLRGEKVKRPSRFSPSSLETLAIIAYQQPVTRTKVEEIRGVDSGGVMKTLLDKGIIRVVGRDAEDSRSLIYGTSRRFLEIFGLQSLTDMPSLQDYHSLQLSQDQDEIQEQKKYAPHIEMDDLVDDSYEAMNEAEQAVLEGLNESIKGLQRVERQVLQQVGLNETSESTNESVQ